MNSETVLIITFALVDGLALIGGIIWFIYFTWFDKKLRAIIINNKNGLAILKVNLINDTRFNWNKGTYIVDKKAVYRRFFRIPYSIYYEGNPNPIIINKQEPHGSKIIEKIKIDEKGNKTITKEEIILPIYTSQELHNILETDFTLKLIQPPTNVKKIFATIGLIVLAGVILLLVLHFTGVIDLRTFFQSTPVKK